MSYYHHGTIRKYTAALLDLFNDVQIQYNNKAGEPVSKPVPLIYTTREKSRILDRKTAEQLRSGNVNVLPRASLALTAITKSDARVTNKNLKIGNYTSTDAKEFMYNSVPYEFTFDLAVMCRGMNEASQIIEQIAPKFNPVINIDVWDGTNLDEPTRVPVKLLDIGIEHDEYEELSNNVFTVIFGLGLVGNLYQPLQSQERVKEFLMKFNEIHGDYYKELEVMQWDVDEDGNLINGTIDVTPETPVIPPVEEGDNYQYDPNRLDGILDLVDITNVTYNEVNMINEIFYRTGHKVQLTYNENFDVKYIKYYNTEGVHINTQTIGYDTNKNLISAIWGIA